MNMIPGTGTGEKNMKTSYMHMTCKTKNLKKIEKIEKQKKRVQWQCTGVECSYTTIKNYYKYIPW